MIQTTYKDCLGSAGSLLKFPIRQLQGGQSPRKTLSLFRRGTAFRKFQVEVDFEIIIIDDELPEIEEILH